MTGRKSCFEQKVWHWRRPPPDENELNAAAAAIKAALNTVIVAGGGVHYSGAHSTLHNFAEAHGIPVIRTQAGKSALPWDHPLNFGPVGVTGADSANAIAAEADLVIGVGVFALSGLHDRIIGAVQTSRAQASLAKRQPYDSSKRGFFHWLPMQRLALKRSKADLAASQAPTCGHSVERNGLRRRARFAPGDGNALLTDMQVIGAVQRQAQREHGRHVRGRHHAGRTVSLWKAGLMSYHMEYGFSCRL